LFFYKRYLYVLTTPEYLSCVLASKPSDDAKCRGFSSSIGANERRDRSLFNGERGIINSHGFAEMLSY